MELAVIILAILGILALGYAVYLQIKLKNAKQEVADAKNRSKKERGKET